MSSATADTATEGPQTAPRLVLKPGEARRVRRGHPWVYGNEIDVKQTPLKGLMPGSIAQLVEQDGSFVGWMDTNPNPVLCGRIASRRGDEFPDADWMRRRLVLALELRAAVRTVPFYRWIYGDADGLSGLVIDRFDDVLVVQITTAAMERRTPQILALVDELVEPRVIVLKNDAKAREREGLGLSIEVAKGTLDGPARVLENGVEMAAPILDGQKTGWFFDHGDNRAWLAQMPSEASGTGRSVLDLFSYAGAWSLPAALRGAAVTAVDSSAGALDVLASSGAALGVAEQLELVCGDVWQALESMQRDKRRFDTVISDPPAFIARKSDVRKGRDAYRRLTTQSLGLVKPGGLLVSASCSSLLSVEDHMAVVRTSARQARRRVLVLHRGGLAPDHPVHPWLPQSDYLKCLFLKVF